MSVCFAVCNPDMYLIDIYCIAHLGVLLATYALLITWLYIDLYPCCSQGSEKGHVALQHSEQIIQLSKSELFKNYMEAG